MAYLAVAHDFNSLPFTFLQCPTADWQGLPNLQHQLSCLPSFTPSPQKALQPAQCFVFFVFISQSLLVNPIINSTLIQVKPYFVVSTNTQSLDSLFCCDMKLSFVVAFMLVVLKVNKSTIRCLP